MSCSLIQFYKSKESIVFLLLRSKYSYWKSMQQRYTDQSTGWESYFLLWMPLLSQRSQKKNITEFFSPKPHLLDLVSFPLIHKLSSSFTSCTISYFLVNWVLTDLLLNGIEVFSVHFKITFCKENNNFATCRPFLWCKDVKSTPITQIYMTSKWRREAEINISEKMWKNTIVYTIKLNKNPRYRSEHPGWLTE